MKETVLAAGVKEASTKMTSKFDKDGNQKVPERKAYGKAAPMPIKKK